MWLKQCHKPTIWEWFIPPIYGDFGVGLLLFYPHYVYIYIYPSYTIYKAPECYLSTVA